MHGFTCKLPTVDDPLFAASPRCNDGELRAVHDEGEGAKTHKGGHGHVGPLTLPAVIGMVMHGVSHSSLGNIPVIGTYMDTIYGQKWIHDVQVVVQQVTFIHGSNFCFLPNDLIAVAAS